MRKMRKTVNLSTKNKKLQVIYTIKKLSSKFTIKDKTKPEHTHNVVYHAQCPESNCTSHYVGQTNCRLKKRVIQHNKSDKKSNLLIHSNKEKHHRVWRDNFQILGRGYKSKFKRKISESLYIKQENPDLNIQKDAYKLKLYK